MRSEAVKGRDKKMSHLLVRHFWASFPLQIPFYPALAGWAISRGLSGLYLLPNRFTSQNLDNTGYYLVVQSVFFTIQV